MVGICAMTKKSKSKPMTQILERLCKFEYITVVVMGEDVILNEPVENWPLCDCLISFHSKGKGRGSSLCLPPPLDWSVACATHYSSRCLPGFPLDKAVAYAKLCKPFLINDLDMQYYIQDRCVPARRSPLPIACSVAIAPSSMGVVAFVCLGSLCCAQ